MKKVILLLSLFFCIGLGFGNLTLAKEPTYDELKNQIKVLQAENKKLKERIEALEFIKDLQQDIIVDFEKVTGQELSKKYLPETLANEIARKKKKLSK